MKQIQLFLIGLVATVCLSISQGVQAQEVKSGAELSKTLTDSYEYWRAAMIKKHYEGWKAITAPHRIVAIQNRIRSEKKPFPGTVFNLPAAPPTTKGLKVLRARANGKTAKLVCFGKVNFGVGGNPTDNLLVLSFIHDGGIWKYDVAEFVNLSALTDVRKQLQSGNYKYVDGEAFIPDGKVPYTQGTVGEAKYITKVYTFCPGREVKVSVNKISQHRFQDITASEVVIGGARDGMNEISYTVKNLPGYKGDDPITIRVYLFSQIPGVKPVKVFQYQTAKGEKPVSSKSGVFNISAEDVAKIMKR